MSIESRSQRHRPKPRRHLAVAAALAAFAVLASVGVALWGGHSWRDQAIAGVFPAPSGDGWDAPSVADGLPAGAGSTGGATSTTGTLSPAGATPSEVPTRTAPPPIPAGTAARTTSPVAVRSTAAPSPTSTRGKGRTKPKPTPPGKPSPTTTGNQSCLLGLIC